MAFLSDVLQDPSRASSAEARLSVLHFHLLFWEKGKGCISRTPVSVPSAPGRGARLGKGLRMQQVKEKLQYLPPGVYECEGVRLHRP